MISKKNRLSEKEVKKFIKYLSSENLKKYRPTFKQIYEFNTQKVLAVNIIEKDLEYWTEKGYINAPYFYNCKINPFYRFVGFLYYKMLTMIIVKNLFYACHRIQFEKGDEN